MLEIKEYTRDEMANELNISYSTKNIRACIKGKLNRLGVEYNISGRGKNAVYSINSLPDAFKTYCMEHFQCAPNTDFEKMKEVFYFVLNDDRFLERPDTEKEQFLFENHIEISRGTIKKYIHKLEEANYLGGGDYIYLVVSKDIHGKHTSRPIPKELYCEGWRIYWKKRQETGGDYYAAYYALQAFLGGHPLKRYVPQQNAFMVSEIERLQMIIEDSFEHLTLSS